MALSIKPWSVFFALIASLAAIQSSLAYLRYQQAQAMHDNLTTVQQLQVSLRQLNIEYSSLSRPENLRILAARLHMAPPRAEQIRYP